MEKVVGPHGEIGVKLYPDENSGGEVLRAFLVISGLCRASSSVELENARLITHARILKEELSTCFNNDGPAILQGATDIGLLRLGLERAISGETPDSASLHQQKALKSSRHAAQEMLDGLPAAADI